MIVRLLRDVTGLDLGQSLSDQLPTLRPSWIM